jgi:hypothetical protein
LNSGAFYGFYGGIGSGRGIGLRADTGFSIVSLGIEGNFAPQSFDAVIWSSVTGHEAGSILASATAVVGGGGAMFYEIPLSFTFSPGAYYVLHWRPTGGTFGGNDQVAYYYDYALPVSVGPVTLIDGTEGYTAESFHNSLHPNLRIRTSDEGGEIPEPSAAGLVALGGAALLVLRRRFAKAA